jgi:hypothetical protein
MVSDSEVAGNSKVGQKRSYDQNGEGPLRAGSFLEVEGQPTNRPSCENSFDKDKEGKSACYLEDRFSCDCNTQDEKLWQGMVWSRLWGKKQ